VREGEIVSVYDMNELAKAAGITRYMIKHYIGGGLLPNADDEGSNRHFTDRHLHILLAVAALRKQGVRAAALKARIAQATPNEVRTLAGVAAPPAPRPAPVVRSRASLLHAVQTAVSAAADALDAPPKRARPALRAALASMRDEKLTVDEALAILEESV
jgi:DNA-binding transcriptional MerR regulator